MIIFSLTVECWNDFVTFFSSKLLLILNFYKINKVSVSGVDQDQITELDDEDGVEETETDAEAKRLINIEKTTYKGKAWDDEALMNTNDKTKDSKSVASTRLPGVTETYSQAVVGDEQKKIIDNYGARIRIEKVETRCAQLQKELDDFKKEMEKKRWDSNVAHSRDREELDSLNNLKKECKIIINGLSSSSSNPPESGPERTVWIKDVVKRLSNAVLPGAGEKVTFVKQMTIEDINFPAAEVSYDTPETARRVRKGFIEKKRAGMDFKKIFMCNVVTLATRVRVDLMQAIVRQFGNDEFKMFVKQFVARPVIVVRESASYGDFALTFTDAVTRFGAVLEEANLAQAYWRTGRAFNDQLEQTFVILNEKGRDAFRSKRENWEESAAVGSGRRGRGGRGRGGGERGRGGRGARRATRGIGKGK